MITYYLSLNENFCINQAFDILRDYFLEPGIHYDRIENDIIVINSIYKYDYLNDCLKIILKDIGYNEEFYLEKHQQPLR